MIDYTELPPGVITLIDAPIAYDADNLPMVYLFHSGTSTNAIALNALGSEYLRATR